ncbi:MAG: hypothetical protein C0613_13730, partial [Desulfobulbaceae bacterium]
IPAFAQYAQLGLYLVDKLFAADSNASSPFVIPAVAVSQKLSGPSLMISFGLVIIVGTQQFHKFSVTVEMGSDQANCLNLFTMEKWGQVRF